MATPAKKLNDLKVIKSEEPDRNTGSQPHGQISLTPARRREIRRRLIAEWRETLDILKRHDLGERSSNDALN